MIHGVLRLKYELRNHEGERNMIKRVICPECRSECEYDNKSVWEGNREFEDFKCPVCGYVLDTVFTDQFI